MAVSEPFAKRVFREINRMFIRYLGGTWRTEEGVAGSPRKILS